MKIDKKIIFCISLMSITRSTWGMEWFRQKIKESGPEFLKKALLTEPESSSTEESTEAVKQANKAPFQRVPAQRGQLKDSIYPIFSVDPAKQSYTLGNKDGAFSFNATDQMYDMAIVHKQENDQDNLFIRIGRPTEEDVEDPNTKQMKKSPSQASMVYKVILPSEQGEATLDLPVKNQSLEGQKNAYINKSCAQAPSPNAYMESPLAIATDGESIFYKPSTGKDNLFKYFYGQCDGELKNKWLVDEYSGVGIKNLTRSRLRAIIGDTKQKRIFFGSEAPNVYCLDADAIFQQADLIVKDAYLVEANEGTLVYGRIFGLETIFEKIARQAGRFFRSAVNKFSPFTLEVTERDTAKIFRIGYYAKFFGTTKPSEINYSEDKLDDCKMLSALETIIYGDLIKFYDMVPAAASKDFAVAFLGRGRGMHIAIQEKKGRLFPTFLSWYKLIKWQLYTTGSFEKSGNGQEWDPNKIIPRKLYIVRPRNEKEHHLMIVTGKDIFLVYTPIENIQWNGNENYNIVINKIFSAREDHIITATTLYDSFNNDNQQKLYIATQDLKNESTQDSFSLHILSDFKSCLESIEDQLKQYSKSNQYNAAKKRWSWLEKEDRQGKRITAE